MASITLAEASKLGLDDLVSGVIENIVTVNPIYQVLPFQDVDGNAKAYNRENALGDAEALGVGGTIAAKAAPTYTQVTTPLTTLIGDAEVNGLQQAQRIGRNGGNDLVAQNIASKAKSVSRLWQNLMINGDTGNAGEFDGLDKIVADGGSQSVDGGAAPLDLDMMDDMIGKVTAKDGAVDFIMANYADIRKYRALLRALGGTHQEQVQVGDYRMEGFAGVPIFRNDYVAAGHMYAGCFDDGSEKVGIAGLTSADNMGIHVESVGAMEARDEHIWRVKFYSAFAVYSGLSVSKLYNFA